MSEEQNIEQSPEDSKFESNEEVNETISQNQTIQQIETTNPKSEISTPDIQNMEVHHHPHVEKKNFKEYFLEFVMIFLAVTMGFIAENVREDITEYQHAKIFAASMMQDIETDTTQLHYYNKYYTYAANNIDTFMQLLATDDIKNIPSGKLYWYGLWGGAHTYFIPNDATFQQMKSSGSLSYFKPGLANDVAKYDRLCRLLQSNEEMNKDIYAEVRKSRATLFEYKYNEEANQVSLKNRISLSQSRIDSFIATNPPLLSYDKTSFNEYVELVRSRFIRNSNVAFSDSLLKQANIVLTELNNKYRN